MRQNPKMITGSRPTQTREVQMRRRIHLEKLRTMQSTSKSNAKPLMDMDEPEKFAHLSRNLKGERLKKESLQKAERENLMLMAKIYGIMNLDAKNAGRAYAPGVKLDSHMRPTLDCHNNGEVWLPGQAVQGIHPINGRAREMEYKKTIEENIKMARALRASKSAYPRARQAAEWARAAGYRSNIARDHTAGYLPAAAANPSPLRAGGELAASLGSPLPGGQSPPLRRKAAGGGAAAARRLRHTGGGGGGGLPARGAAVVRSAPALDAPPYYPPGGGGGGGGGGSPGAPGPFSHQEDGPYGGGPPLGGAAAAASWESGAGGGPASPPGGEAGGVTEWELHERLPGMAFAHRARVGTAYGGAGADVIVSDLAAAQGRQGLFVMAKDDAAGLTGFRFLPADSVGAVLGAAGAGAGAGAGAAVAAAAGALSLADALEAPRLAALLSPAQTQALMEALCSACIISKQGDGSQLCITFESDDSVAVTTALSFAAEGLENRI